MKQDFDHVLSTTFESSAAKRINPHRFVFASDPPYFVIEISLVIVNSLTNESNKLVILRENGLEVLIDVVIIMTDMLNGNQQAENASALQSYSLT